MSRPVAWVTGSSGGLGRALALHLASKGYAVAVHGHRNQEGTRESLQLCRAITDEVCVVRGDLSREAVATKAVAAIQKKWGRLDLLLLNAGTFAPQKLDQISEAEWKQGLDSTVSAAFFASRAALPLLRSTAAQTRQGRIVLIGDSMCQHIGFTEPAFSYYVGKVGVWMLTQTLAVLEAPSAITVNCISPGILERSLPLTAPIEFPMLRKTTHQDVISAMEYLVSPEASQVTGTQILVSGGWNIAPSFASVHFRHSSKC